MMDNLLKATIDYRVSHWIQSGSHVQNNRMRVLVTVTTDPRESVHLIRELFFCHIQSHLKVLLFSMVTLAVSSERQVVK